MERIISLIIEDSWINTIAAYSIHLDEVEGMEMERYMEAWEQNQVAELAHYSMDHAIQDMQVGHTLLVPADEPDGVGMERQKLVECGMEAEADALLNHMREGDVRRKKPEAAQVVDNKVFGDEDLFVVYWVFGFGFQLVGSYY